MKINWGHKLTMVFIAFGALMITLVYKSMNTHFDLVTKEYYKDELAYQGVIDGMNNANKLSENVKVELNAEDVQIRIPETNGKPASGKIWFYCITDASKDRKFSMLTDENGNQSVNRSMLQPGNYTVKLEWVNDGLNYYAEQRIKIKP